MKTKMLVGVGLTAFTLALAAKDAVIMTVNGVDVPRSEFEYLYHKNSQQQMDPQPINEYVDLFKLYKLKVADARAEGLDTLESFRNEMAQYRHDLAAPYLADSTYLNTLLDEAVARSKEEVEARHIMFFKTRDAKTNAELRQRADSLVKVLRAGGDFGELAGKYSQDRGSNGRGGYMGYITALRFPYNFETAAYTLNDGEISDVVESPQGYHILKGGHHRPASGKVHASHILISTQGSTDNGVKAKALADSLYKVVSADPSKFADVARRFSDDPGSGKNGGDLSWFGRGEMVQEFDSVSFAIPDGAISEPFATRFGYHIINRHESKGAPSKEELSPVFYSRLSQGDERGKLVKLHQTNTLEKKHKGKVNTAVFDALKADVRSNGIDSLFYQKWTGSPKQIASIGKKKYPVGGFIDFLGGRQNPNSGEAERLLSDAWDAYYNNLLVEVEEDMLMATTPEYANLYREYVDGSLLYEISVRKVWDKAAKDEKALQAYFEENKDDYRWDAPRAKGYLVEAINDSVASLVKKRALEIGRDSLVNSFRKEFPREVSIKKVLEPRGANAMVDNLIFNGPEADVTNSKYKVYFMLDPRVLTLPEELNDVKGIVTTDYQNELQAAWEEELLKKYPVKVNEKEVKKVGASVR
ncbi:MAG: peptidylprolyl isomerase [Muribaculaceae bacterium]|nr:peptidylprolyl isomerase [Muribaculaceae bacterium]